ncbi:hypothetical protein Tsubulata_045688 [Turnera subulata]|uniref:Cytochrome P450 n=1 Tax=Turnera subulata TaxID=218843 RepID=A0A9Q0J2G6_9ROSI|nr:hypothetical protein Tsubulata_045688 [Turnera subulata]
MMSTTMNIAAGSWVLLLTVVFMMITKTFKRRLFPNPNSGNLPPGSLGWPLMGETMEFMRSALSAEPESFVRERVQKNGSRVFKTSILGEPFIFFCGPPENKFLFSNENKSIITSWWPNSIRLLFKASLVNAVGDEVKRIKRILMACLNPDALKRYIGTIDSFTQDHIKTYWEGKEEVKVHNTVQLYTFELACRLFASISDAAHISKLGVQFHMLNKGMISLPIDIPGTRFYDAKRAADAVREELLLVVRERKEALLDNKRIQVMSPTPQQDDLISHLLVTADVEGRCLSEMEIVDNTLLFLFAGYDTTQSALTSLMKYLAQLPHVYAKVLREHMEIANAKQAGELLKWEDIQKMQYSWSVVSEVLRLSPPIRGGFREATADFTYAGYTIPKGWKLCWFMGYTQKDPSVFPDPERFDASRFEGGGPSPYCYVPFGGGDRKCIGQDFARLEILVFLHNIVTRFQWDLVIPGESFAYDPTILAPSHGLPIRLHPRPPTSSLL